MRLVKSWMIDELLPVAIDTYSSLEQELGITIINPYNILEFHPTLSVKETFNERAKQHPEYLHPDVDETQWQPLFNFHYGIGSISQCMIINLRILQDAWRNKLKNDGTLIEEKFDWSHCTVSHDKVVYKNIEGQKIIFCDGAVGVDNPYFARLPFALNKGEILLVDIPELPRDHVYKHGLKIAPWEDNLFWVGSSFDWKYDNLEPSAIFRTKTEQQLKSWLKLPFTVHNHWASVRPATVDHKPFAGFHPLHPSVGILNGMGAKGCSQAPYFAQSVAQHLVQNTPLHREADIARFTKILSKA